MKIDPEKMCFVPLVQGATMSMLRLYNEGDLASLEADNKFHIREPHPYYKDGGDAILRDDGMIRAEGRGVEKGERERRARGIIILYLILLFFQLLRLAVWI